MARDFEDSYDIESMTDEELETLVRESLDEYPDLDPSGLEFTVEDGQLRISGRVGTEAEVQVIQQVLTDVIGIQHVQNELVVDELVRLQQDDAADVANAALYEAGGAAGGANRTEDSAEHLLEDTAAEQFGTSDMGEAIDRGHSYNPPDSPVQEGSSREDH